MNVGPEDGHKLTDREKLDLAKRVVRQELGDDDRVLDPVERIVGATLIGAWPGSEAESKLRLAAQELDDYIGDRALSG